MIEQLTSVQEAIRFNPSYLRKKYLLDMIFTLIALIPICLIILIVSVLIRINSKGPIFYRQKRIGQNGVEFEMLKFRSMYVNSDDVIHREAVSKFMNGQTLSDTSRSDLSYKQVNDPRITRVGRFIRKTSIDEIPQFFNILRGEMTLVGPRPPLPYEVEFYSPEAYQRLCGKPGLTGIWQVYGRSRVSFSRMVEMDIEYLKQQSIKQDLKVIALTIPVIIKARGGA
jgi:lipopolysaccharide/colanic/teichoic acid biosynthesis glycosyltransferase